MIDSNVIQHCKHQILEESSFAKQETIFAAIERINGYHDQLHRHVMDSVDQVCRENRELPTFEYCWLEMGSGGREERTFWTDQDNAIIYRCAEPEQALVQDFLQDIAAQVIERLNEWGYPLCQGGVMANHTGWLLTVQGWKGNWKRWTEDLTLNHMRYLLISADMRPLYGDESLISSFQQWAFELIKPAIGRLAEYSLRHPLPIGVFGQLFTEPYGEYMGNFHLKEGGYYQLVGLVRVLALSAGVRETSTRKRISALSKLGYLSRQEADDLENALAFFLYARLKHHLNLVRKGKTLQDYIDLSTMDKSFLKQLKRHVKNIEQQQARWRRELRRKGGII